MKNKITWLVIVILAFVFGYQLSARISEIKSEKGRVTGIGGVFFKCKNPKELKAWYRDNLGMNVNEYGAVFEWRQASDSTKKGYSQWSLFSEKTKYFQPSNKDFMINYRVAHMESLLAELRKKNVTIVDSVQVYDYGKFVHIMDPDGNNLELWEPNDLEYEKMGKQLGSSTIK